MLTDVIDSYIDFKRLKPTWDSLYLIDPDAQLFLSWDWISQLFHRMPDKNFFIIAVRLGNRDADYVAFLPLCLKLRKSNNDQGFHNEIYMAGNYWADYTGFICDPRFEHEAARALASRLKTMYWEKLHLDYVYQSPDRFDAFISMFEKGDFEVASKTRISKIDNVNGLICPYVILPDNFENYLAGNLSANTRQKLRRFMRKVANSDDLRVTHTSAETYERDLGILEKFWKKKWADRKGDDTARLGETYAQILYQALRANMLHMPILWRADRPLGVLGCLIDRAKKSLLFYVAGRDESCTDLPSGLILHGYNIRWAIENGFEIYDLLAGNEPYKYSLGVRERRLRCVEVTTKLGANLNGRLDPRSVDEALDRTTRAHRRGNLVRAENGYRQVLQIRPDSAPALRGCAGLLAEAGRLTEASSHYRRLVSVLPEDVAAWTRLAWVSLALNACEDAQTALRMAIALGVDGSRETLYRLALSRLGSGDAAGAAEAFRGVLETVPQERS